MTVADQPPDVLRTRYPTLHQLAIFLAVARLQNFTRAAEELLLSQPSVSMQVHRLEQLLGGGPLFERAGRRLVLTEAGAELVHYAGNALGQLDDGMAAIKELQGLKRGRLRVAADTTAGVYVVPALLGIFKARYPQVSISLSVVNRASVQEQLEAHEVDLAVMGHTMAGDNLVVTPLRPNRLVVIAPPGHRLAARCAIPLPELCNEGFILREHGSGTRASTESYFEQQGIRVPVVMELSDNGAIKQAVAAGIGLAVLSESAVELELGAGRVVVLDVAGFPLLRHWYTVRLAGKRLPPPARAFLAQLHAEASVSNDMAAPRRTLTPQP